MLNLKKNYIELEIGLKTGMIQRGSTNNMFAQTMKSSGRRHESKLNLLVADNSKNSTTRRAPSRLNFPSTQGSTRNVFQLTRADSSFSINMRNKNLSRRMSKIEVVDEEPTKVAKKISSMQGWFTQQFQEGVHSRTFNPHHASSGNVKYHKALIPSLSTNILEERQRPYSRNGSVKTEKELNAHQNHLNHLK